MQDPTSTIVALDIGQRRIGVAIASRASRLAKPFKTVINDDTVIQELQKVLREQHAEAMVVGLPRGLDGQRTAQTDAVEAFITGLRQHVTLPIYWQDEALTSKQAEAELNSRGKPYLKGDIDALAATYILEDFMQEQFKETSQ
jgi:putative holliday junction resolvase